MVPSVSSGRGGRAGSATSLPVPGHQPKAKKHKLFLPVSVPAPTQKRRKSLAQESQVVAGATISRLFGEPRVAAQSCLQKYRGASCATSKCGVPRQGREISSSRRQMASTIVACLALSAGGMHLAVCPWRILLLTRTPQQELKIQRIRFTPHGRRLVLAFSHGRGAEDRELRRMSRVVKDATLGVKQHGARACAIGRLRWWTCKSESLECLRTCTAAVVACLILESPSGGGSRFRHVQFRMPRLLACVVGLTLVSAMDFLIYTVHPRDWTNQINDV